MTELMLCNHKQTKVKMIAWATTDRHGHLQGFKRVRCCVKCGCEVKEKSDG